ncbi:capsule biosynthesis protein CapA [Natrinema sp. CBA1119]|uniref:CapA family protein n=1 Tax=Natrinema sp. CBA1119 TaxID=1608465 RepID=UPI000BF3BA5F|nr:CapA family protein [Natrinema sp. CBA1119]PGF13839.1 capsule biosynthesis protein CapA [Natrinema sp. CBA1119]
MSGTGNTLTVAAAGDAMVTRRLTRIRHGRFRELRRVITDADASVINLEGPLYEDEDAPTAGPLAHFRSPPRVINELTSTGFDLFSAANNHIGDYGQSGVSRTIKILERRDLPYAGIGQNRAAARAPTYLETRAGRVALLAVTTTFVPGTEAAHRRRDAPGRPGVASLRMRPRYTVTDNHLEGLRKLRDALGMDDLINDRGRYVDESDDTEAVSLLSLDDGPAGDTIEFQRGEKNRISFELHSDDLAEIQTEIETANRNADVVIMSVHSHEGESGRYNDESVPSELETFARDCIDTGVDMVCCHGPHRVRGIELYGGAPIFYSLGNFALQYHMVPFFPAETYEALSLERDASPLDVQEALGSPVAEDVEKQGIVPVCSFDDSGLREIRLHPIELGVDRDVSHHGTPALAEGAVAATVLERLSTLSDAYGTDIQTREGIGTVEL